MRIFYAPHATLRLCVGICTDVAMMATRNT